MTPTPTTTAPATLATAADPLLAYREEFPILARTTYLVSHSLGAMPRRAYDHLRAFADQWATRGVRAWGEGWWTGPVEAGDRLGRVIGAAPGSVAMQQNVTIALAIVLSCFDWKPPRRKVVTTSLEFPTILYACDAQRRLGAEVVIVRGDAEGGLGIDLGRLCEAIDDETALVITSHVQYKSAFLQDAGAIAARCREKGALLCLDTYQSAGTVPLDVTALGIDFACGGSVKWLCGGPGAAYLYVRPDLAPKLEPRLTGWAAHAAPFAFEPPPQRYAPGAARFLHGTPAVPALFSARAGHEIVAEVGVDRIRAKSTRQTNRLVEHALARGFAVNTPRDPARRGGTVTVDVPESGPVAAELVRRDILVDHRPGAGIRISPHFYTTDAELDRVLAEIDEIVRTRSYASRPASEAERRF
jgi:kynureninase